MKFPTDHYAACWWSPDAGWIVGRVFGSFAAVEFPSQWFCPKPERGWQYAIVCKTESGPSVLFSAKFTGKNWLTQPINKTNDVDSLLALAKSNIYSRPVRKVGQ